MLEINELKNTIERQELMIEKMKNCYNCKNIDKWELKDD